ncbi:hypothetical protein [Roseomonas sp. BN140053]|uniref:hypothetical protein n=1 Tax=Roseomonas sp. BN140053 TaxID=3391898 RepID=UPI0039ED21C4
MAVDWAGKKPEELRQILANCKARGMMEAPFCIAAQEELDRRAGSAATLDPERTRAALLDAAKRERFLSYRDVAEASGLEWNGRIFVGMPDHLAGICIRAHRQGLPLLSAIVVKMEEVPTGELSGPALDGFLKLADRLGLPIGATPAEHRRFLRDEQRKVFTWAKSASR